MRSPNPPPHSVQPCLPNVLSNALKHLREKRKLPSCFQRLAKQEKISHAESNTCQSPPPGGKHDQISGECIPQRAKLVSSPRYEANLTMTIECFIECFQTLTRETQITLLFSETCKTGKISHAESNTCQSPPGGKHDQNSGECTPQPAKQLASSPRCEAVKRARKVTQKGEARKLGDFGGRIRKSGAPGARKTQLRLRASRCMVPVQCRKLSNSQRETQKKPAMLFKVSASARWPE